MAWQTWQVARAGVNLLWWTDHSDIYSPRVPDFVIQGGLIKLGPSLWSVGTWGPGNAGRAFLRGTQALTAVRVNACCVEVELGPRAAGVVDTIILLPC